ncbi:hypothetical protein DFH27DRAFT_34354 [Peziza echinospora]|nr:hypothetical protein DFH27DRAFT_34354 [Peziza echinospora]
MGQQSRCGRIVAGCAPGVALALLAVLSASFHPFILSSISPSISPSPVSTSPVSAASSPPSSRPSPQTRQLIIIVMGFLATLVAVLFILSLSLWVYPHWDNSLFDCPACEHAVNYTVDRALSSRLEALLVDRNTRWQNQMAEMKAEVSGLKLDIAGMKSGP